MLAGSLILDFLAPQTVRSKCWLFKPPSLWYFVIAAQADCDSLSLYIAGLQVNVNVKSIPFKHSKFNDYISSSKAVFKD